MFVAFLQLKTAFMVLDRFYLYINGLHYWPTAANLV